MSNSKFTRCVCAMIIGVVGGFKCLWLFIKMVVMIRFEEKRNGQSLDMDAIIDTAKLGIRLYIAQMRAIFEWVNDGDMENCRKNVVKYMEEVKP